MSLSTLIAALGADSETAIVVTDGMMVEPGPTILYVNAAFERLTGFSSEELLGASPRKLQGQRTSLVARKALSRALRKGERHKTTLINYRKSGEPYRCEIELFPILAANGELMNVVALEREIGRRPGRRPANTV